MSLTPVIGDETYTFAHLEAAACMWEHVLHALRRHREGRNPWEEYREAYGMCELRERVIRHAPVLEVEYQKAVANGYEQSVRLGVRAEVHGGSRCAHTHVVPCARSRNRTNNGELNPGREYIAPGFTFLGSS